MGNDRMTICRKIKLFPVGDKEEINRVYDFIRNGQYAQYQACNLLMGQLMSEYYKYNRDIKNEEFKARQKEIMTNSKFMNGKAYVHEVRKKNGLYVDLGEYTDTFKVNNYSKKVITNRKNLRKWMRKRYFDLEEWQLEKISKFFKENPDGVITFG